MVLKPSSAPMLINLTFESDVISDGTQTFRLRQDKILKFESDVISDGTQTTANIERFPDWFESDVISDGTQTRAAYKITIL